MSLTQPRGTTNQNVRGSSYSRARRRQWLVATYRADRDLIRVTQYAADGVPDDVAEIFVVEPGTRSIHDLVADYKIELENGTRTTAEVVPACRCYRCGCLLTTETLTVDRIIPGCEGGSYRRDNIRPACAACNVHTGNDLRTQRRRQAEPGVSTCAQCGWIGRGACPRGPGEHA